MPMSLSTSDMTRLKRLNSSKNYATNGIVLTEDLTSSQLAECGVKCSSKRTDMKFVGKLKTVRETSKIIDFKASQVADYVLVSEYSGSSGLGYSGSSSFGRKLTRTTLCPTTNPSACVTVLSPKVILRV
jgi:hypothetical protein